MAQRVVTLLEDDIDGGDAAETVTFALDGTTYEIDLNEKNAESLRDVLAPYIGASRKVGRKTGTAGPRASKPNTREVRDWARSQGMEVPERGRIPGAVMDAWNAR